MSFLRFTLLTAYGIIHLVCKQNFPEKWYFLPPSYAHVPKYACQYACYFSWKFLVRAKWMVPILFATLVVVQKYTNADAKTNPLI